MAGLDFEEMRCMQQELHRKYHEKFGEGWKELSPDIGRDKLLWMFVEAGEVADIIKKQGDVEIMENSEVRCHFTEEMCDVMMYFNDVLICYGITPEEMARVYREKHERNLQRW